MKIFKKDMVRFNVEVKDKEKHYVLKCIVNQLVEKKYIKKIKMEFIEYATTKGYVISDRFEIDEPISTMNSENGVYYLSINTFEELELKNNTCLDGYTKYMLSEDFYSGK